MRWRCLAPLRIQNEDDDGVDDGDDGNDPRRFPEAPRRPLSMPAAAGHM